jgi:hypothetical protein
MVDSQVGCRYSEMVTGGHKHCRGEDCTQRRKVEMDKELSEIQAEMEKIALKMKKEEKVRWRYRWHLKRTTRWPIQKLLSRRKQHVLKGCLICVEKPNGEGKIYGRGIIGCQVGNEKGSVDFINYQEGRGGITIFLVGKGEEMSSAESLCQGVLTGREEAEEKHHPYEDSCGAASCMKEYDDKLKNFVTEEKGQRSFFIIGGIQIFMPRI